MRTVLTHDKGASAIEFALLAPVFFLLIFGILQLGILFFANSGLHNALAEGARHATLYPRPNEAAIKTKINAARWGLDTTNLTIAPIVYGAANNSAFAEITMRYSLQLDFIFLTTPPITLVQSRRVYLQTLPS